MKRIFLLLSIPFVLVSSVVCQQSEAISPTRKRYTVSGDGFSVALHSRPSITTTRVSLKDGKERTKRFLTATVNSVVYNIEVFENLEPRQPLEEFIAESKSSLQFDPATERNLTVDDFQGKEYSSQTETTIIVMQFFATKDRLFRFAATGPAAATPEIKEFFDLIKLGPNTRGIDLSEFTTSNTGEKIYKGRGVDVKARLLTKPEPAYTKDARDNKIEGTVILRVVFSKTGRVENLTVLQGLPYGLTRQAIDAARKIEFIPAMKDGKPVSMWMQLEYNFSL